MQTVYPKQHSRTIQLLGEERYQKLQDTHVTVCGLGAVGSFATEALARAGVGHLRLIDFDTVNPTNINRQIYALHSSVGQPKCLVAGARILDINPACEVEIQQEFIDEITAPILLDSRIDVLVDAIDSVSSKVHLLRTAHAMRVPTVTSMGAAGRFRSAHIFVDDIDKSQNCPLARIIRKRLHRHGIYTGIRCVYSDEPAQNKNPIPDVTVIDEHDSSRRGRERTPIGSVSYLTGMFGLKIAEEVIRLVLKE